MELLYSDAKIRRTSQNIHFRITHLRCRIAHAVKAKHNGTKSCVAKYLKLSQFSNLSGTPFHTPSNYADEFKTLVYSSKNLIQMRPFVLSLKNSFVLSVREKNGMFIKMLTSVLSNKAFLGMVHQ